MKIGPVELIIILVIVIMIFGVGKLPQAAGSLGKAMREFRKETRRDDDAIDEKVEEVAPKKKRVTATRKQKATKTAAKKETEV